MLDVSELTCGYDGRDVVKGVSLRVNRGDTLCIIGPNGSGKTTLLRAFLRLIDYRGSVLFEGRDIKSIPRRELARGIAFLPQISTIYFSYTVFDTVALGRYSHLKGPLSGLGKWDEEYIMSCLESVGLADLKDRQISTLSGGQLQRVYLARVFAQDPKLILLDEPTNHLDLRHQIELLGRLSEWSRQGDRAVVGVLHDLNEVFSFATQVVLLDEGTVAERGCSARVLSSQALSQVYRMDISEWMTDSLKKWVKDR